MSINVFRKQPDNKITFSNRAILSGDLKIMQGLGLRWYFVSMVPGSVECKTCCLLYVTLVNSLSPASSTSFSTVLWCCSQRPERMPWRMTACSRFRSSSAVAKPHHELAAYTSFATTTDLKTMWTEAASCRGSWVFAGWTLCEQEEITLLTCSCTERALVTVTPR